MGPAANESARQVESSTQAQTTRSSASDILLPVLGFIGTGIGIIGFVIFFGGFVLWTRFDAEGLPASDAVAKVPRNDLISTGANFLVYALLVALVSVLVAYVFWDFFVGNRRRRRTSRLEEELYDAETHLGDLSAEAEGIGEDLSQAERELKRTEAEVDRLGSRAQLHLDAMSSYQEAVNREQIGSEAWQAAGEAYRKAKDECDAAAAEYEEAKRKYDEQKQAADESRRPLQDRLRQLRENEIRLARRAVDEAKSALDAGPKPDRTERFQKYVIGGGTVFVAEGIIFGFSLSGLGLIEFLLLVAAMAVTIAVSIVVLTQTGNFGWYAACVFVGVGVFIAFSTYDRTNANTKASPVTAIDGRTPVTGFFVAETSDAVYVGKPVVSTADEPALDHKAITLLRFPKESLTALTIGGLTNEVDAYKYSVTLALALCENPSDTTTGANQGAVGSVSSAASAESGQGAGPACSDRAIQDLRETLSTLQ
jgi:hypothetical protein